MLAKKERRKANRRSTSTREYLALGVIAGLSALCSTGASYAQTDARKQAQEQAQEQAENDVIGVVRSDWNGDGVIDSAVLMASEEGADLYIFNPTAKGRDLSPLIARELVWHGVGLYGQEAGLELSPSGDIVVTSQNTAIGRNRWSERLTLRYLDGAMRVSRYQRIAYDTLDLDWSQECDVDMITGKGVLNGKPIHVPGGAPPVQAWTMESAPPKACEVE